MPGNSPVAGDLHVNVPLTNFSQKYLLSQDMFVATKAFPNAPVSKQSDLYYEFNRGDFFRDEAEERADGTESSGSGFRLSTNPYFAKVYAFHKDVTDRQRKNQDAQIQLDNSATQFVTHKMLIRRERIFKDAYFKTGIWTTDDSSQNWSLTASDPVSVIRAAARTIQLSTGYRPNKILIGRSAYDTLIENDSILARVSGGATTAIPAMVMRTLLTQLLEVSNIYVMDAVYNSANADLSDPTAITQAYVGGDDMLLYYAPDTVSLNEPSAGVQFSWTGMMGNTDSGSRIKRFRMEHLEADRIEAQMAFDYKLTSADLGYFFSTVSA